MKIQLLSLLFAAILVLNSCGGGTASSTATDNPPPPASSSSVTTTTSSSSIASSLAVSSAVTSSTSVNSSTATASLNSSSTSSLVVSSSSKASSSTLSSTSSNQSSSTIANCASADGGVFIDSVCSGWRDISYFELKKTANSVSETEDGSAGALINVSSINTGEAGHFQVLDFVYNGNNDYNAIARIRNPISATAGVDMSAYATGKLVFDIKVISQGDAKQPLHLVLDCGYPCENTPYLVKTSTLNQWQKVEVSVADMMLNGLDIKHVYTGFQLSPPWDSQKNVHFQVDNIRWVKGSNDAIPEICYAQHFDRKDRTYGTNLRGFIYEPKLELKSIFPISIVSPTWLTNQDSWGYFYFPSEEERTQFNLCLANSHKMSFSVYVPASYVTDGKMRMGLAFLDSAGKKATSFLTSASQVKPDDWNRVIVDISLMAPPTLRSGAGVFADDGFKSNDITSIGAYFEANGKAKEITGDVRVDNILMWKDTSDSNSSSAGTCSAGSQTFNGTTQLGIGFAAGQKFFVRAALKNATLVGINSSLTSSNTSSLAVQNNSASIVFEFTTNTGVTGTEQLQAAFAYQVTNASTAASVIFSVYSTLTDAINATNSILSSSTSNLASGVTCSSSSSSSAKSSSSSSSSVTSSGTSSSAGFASSSSSSNASCSVGVKTHNSSPTIGFGFTQGSHAFVSVKLANAKFIGGAPQLSIPNSNITLGFANDTKAVYDITANDFIPSTSAFSLSFDYQQQDTSVGVSRDFAVYSTASAAMNDSGALTSSSATITNACGP